MAYGVHRTYKKDDNGFYAFNYLTLGGVWSGWLDDKQQKQGEFIVTSATDPLVIITRGYMLNNKRHGYYWKASTYSEPIVKFFYEDEDITCEVEKVVEDLMNITDEECVVIKLRWGFECQ